MRATLPILLMCLGRLMAASASAQPGQHAHEKKTEHGQSQSAVLSGKLVDSTWFADQKEASSKDDRIARASANVANGVPASVLPDGDDEQAPMWILLTNPAVLAPYVGKYVKVEGRLLRENRAIVPSAVYVDDAGTWRQVQLAEPSGKPPTIEPSRTEHSAGHEMAAGRSEEGAKSEPAHVEHPDEHEKPSAVAQRGNHEPSHPTGKEGSERKPDADREHQHEHRHWLVLAMPPAHPLLVNFTAGLFPAAVLTEWLGRLLRRRSLRSAAWWMLLIAAVVTPLTALAGWFWFREVGDMGHGQMAVHKWVGTSLAVVLLLLAIWRGRLYARDRDPSKTYLATATVVLLALSLQGHLGATMSFLPHENQTARPGDPSSEQHADHEH